MSANLFGMVFLKLPQNVILRAWDFFDGYPTLYFGPPNKAVILTEALRGSVADGALWRESKDPGDAYYPCRSELFRHRSRIWRTRHGLSLGPRTRNADPVLGHHG
jgi:hypothetical protein